MKSVDIITRVSENGVSRHKTPDEIHNDTLTALSVSLVEDSNIEDLSNFIELACQWLKTGDTTIVWAANCMKKQGCVLIITSDFMEDESFNGGVQYSIYRFFPFGNKWQVSVDGRTHYYQYYNPEQSQDRQEYLVRFIANYFLEYHL